MQDRLQEIRERCERANEKPAEEMRIQEVAQMRADNKRLLRYCDELLQKTQQIAALQAENDRLKEAQRWIPVSERLPGSPQEVLVWIKNAGTYIGYYNNLEGYKCWMMGLGERISGVTHWMPLPAKPDEQKGE
ncbi:MAG: DUF551 domain-containing protein [Bacillota bacterium]